MKNNTLFFKGKETAWEQVDTGVTRQIVGYDDHIMMVNVRFEKDGIGPLHSHHHSQTTYISEGKFEVTIDGTTKLLEQGDSFFIPSNIVHGVTCTEKGMLVDVFSPVREDFLS